MRALAVLLVAGACGRLGFDPQQRGGDAGISDGSGGAPATFVPPWHSGPRLRARLLIGGGDPIFYGWHDSQLDTDCQPVIASDGVERCMPFRARTDTIFADAGCTQPLALVYLGTCGKDRYAFANDVSGRTHAYPIAGLHAGPIYSGPGCTQMTLPAGQEAHDIGAEEPVSSFLIGSYHQQRIGSFMHSFNDFSDGATRDVANLVLTDTSCSPVATEVGPVRCRVSAPRAAKAYADAGCTQPILVWTRDPYDLPSATLLKVYPPQLCDSTYELYQTIADVTAASYYVKTTAGCSQAVTAGNQLLYTATAIADPSPMGTVVRGPDRGRIGTYYWIGPDDVAIAVGNFDQQTGAPCTPFNAADRMLRCLPSRAVAHAASEDATCTAAPQNVYGACFGAPPTDGPTYTACTDGPQHVHALATQVPAASVDDDGACVTVGAAYDATATGAELPASSFPALIEMVE